MTHNTAPGEDGVVAEAIKLGGRELLKAITKLFNKCLDEGKITQIWPNATIGIMHKKRNGT